MSIHVTDRVKVVHADGELSCLIGAIGKVDRIHELATGRIAIVKIIPDDVNCYREIVVKFPVENLEKVEPEIEIPEGAKLISKEDFEGALKKITNPETVFANADDPTHALFEGLATTLFGCKLMTILFNESDTVILTEDDFVRSLWDACNPAIGRNGVIPSVRAYDGLLMAVTSIIHLRHIVEILFGGSHD